MIPGIARNTLLMAIKTYTQNMEREERLALFTELAFFCSRFLEWSGIFAPEWMVILVLLEEEKSGRLFLA